MNTETLRDFLKSLSSQQHGLLNKRNTLFIEQPADSFRPAAVLLALVPRQEEWQILLTKRAETLKHHTGQVAFPGGGYDTEDASLTETALREAHEEVGTPCHTWETFDIIPPCYTPSGYAVYTVPALSETEPRLTLNPSEVAEAFYVPLSLALDTANYQQRIFQYQNRTVQSPALPYLHYDIWGLTASILYSMAEHFRRYR
ncbi:NUDIX hydrolase [Neisseria wadsworthii]|uniref:MutT/NUDIX family protein n=1 Tax=Neisseria wadsworthii 9715 TaxID=1030841 RepID=G4CT68_9NEIS|nr:CoA pyrophosphatase [Neisseria wadsworthii]EGZ44430.1 MutT/NUDIX family protein [Neisseria wadsworthii 9715]QMT35865.1 CoA pyrophosphatase [Neisseria wadsworthii]